MSDADIRLEGRAWRRDEMIRHDDLPGKLEMVGGKLCLDEEQRILLLGALLEHVGTARAVRLGPVTPWIEAVALRARGDGDGDGDTLSGEGRPAAGVARFIADQRALLTRLEAVSTTPNYRRLFAQLAPLAAGDIEPWFAHWLITWSAGLGDLPLNVLDRPDALALFEETMLGRGVTG